MKLIIQSTAREDILRQYRYYLVEKNAEEAAARFLAAVQETIQQIGRRPATGAPKILNHLALQGLRSASINGFPSIRIYYLTSEAGVRVLRILHGKRDIASILENETE